MMAPREFHPFRLGEHLAASGAEIEAIVLDLDFLGAHLGIESPWDCFAALARFGLIRTERYVGILPAVRLTDAGVAAFKVAP